MAIDTTAKRSSALDHEEIWQFGIPFPDGTISQADRQHLAHSYSGILIETLGVGIRTLTLWLKSVVLTIESQSANLTFFDADSALTVDNDD